MLGLIILGYLLNGCAIVINGTQTLALVYAGDFVNCMFRLTVMAVNILCIYAIRVCQKDKCE